mmetsp:Transcript_26692/g.47505  ORF Transcript_26692/g.47505 Transcript_26692/m.47505 type:complete len:259 (+) Transcript_26692:1831-2607(+)
MQGDGQRDESAGQHRARLPHHRRHTVHPLHPRVRGPQDEGAAGRQRRAQVPHLVPQVLRVVPRENHEVYQPQRLHHCRSQRHELLLLRHPRRLAAHRQRPPTGGRQHRRRLSHILGQADGGGRVRRGRLLHQRRPILHRPRRPPRHLPLLPPRPHHRLRPLRRLRRLALLPGVRDGGGHGAALFLRGLRNQRRPKVCAQAANEGDRREPRHGGGRRKVGCWRYIRRPFGCTIIRLCEALCDPALLGAQSGFDVRNVNM